LAALFAAVGARLLMSVLPDSPWLTLMLAGAGGLGCYAMALRATGTPEWQWVLAAAQTIRSGRSVA
jgi:hypothetical protein